MLIEFMFPVLVALSINLCGLVFCLYLRYKDKVELLSKIENLRVERLIIKSQESAPPAISSEMPLEQLTKTLEEVGLLNEVIPDPYNTIG